MTAGAGMVGGGMPRQDDNLLEVVANLREGSSVDIARNGLRTWDNPYF